MPSEFKVAIIGLDTSHCTEFPRLMQDPATSPENRVNGLRAVSCLRFETPFQNREGLDKRQEYLESIGVKVTENFDEAICGCDAVMLEINDPSLHLEYFEKCAALKKPLFLDKPFADSVENMQKMIRIARENQTRFFTSSSLRFDADLRSGLAGFPQVHKALVWGPIGKAAAGSDILWYGCHSFEMLQKIMGQGAGNVTGFQEGNSYIFQIGFPDGRRGTVELTPGSPFGALLRDKDHRCQLINVTGKIPIYRMLLQEIADFFNGKEPVALADSVEVMLMMEAAEKSLASGRTEKIICQAGNC